MIPSVQIICGDSATELAKLPNASIDLVVTSPPYDNLRTYEGHSWSFESTATHLFRVLKEGGAVCWIVDDQVIDGSESCTSCRQKLYFRETGFRVHDTMIYQQSNFTAPEINRYHQLFEYIFVFTKGRPKTFNPICDKRNNYAGRTAFGINTMREPNGELLPKPVKIIREFGMRGNVWLGNTAGQENPCQSIEHPATMPTWLAHDLILSWSDIGDTVLDPFAGSGTTGQQALELGRSAILIEIAEKYIPLIEKRCTTTLGLALA